MATTMTVSPLMPPPPNRSPGPNHQPISTPQPMAVTTTPVSWTRTPSTGSSRESGSIRSGNSSMEVIELAETPTPPPPHRQSTTARSTTTTANPYQSRMQGAPTPTLPPQNAVTASSTTMNPYQSRSPTAALSSPPPPSANPYASRSADGNTSSNTQSTGMEEASFAAPNLVQSPPTVTTNSTMIPDHTPPALSAPPPSEDMLPTELPFEPLYELLRRFCANKPLFLQNQSKRFQASLRQQGPKLDFAIQKNPTYKVLGGAKV